MVLLRRTDPHLLLRTLCNTMSLDLGALNFGRAASFFNTRRHASLRSYMGLEHAMSALTSWATRCWGVAAAPVNCFCVLLDNLNLNAPRSQVSGRGASDARRRAAASLPLQALTQRLPTAPQPLCYQSESVSRRQCGVLAPSLNSSAYKAGRALPQTPISYPSFVDFDPYTLLLF